MKGNITTCCAYFVTGVFEISPLTTSSLHNKRDAENLQINTPAAGNDQLANTLDKTDIFNIVSGILHLVYPAYKMEKKSFFDFFDRVAALNKINIKMHKKNTINKHKTSFYKRLQRKKKSLKNKGAIADLKIHRPTAENDQLSNALDKTDTYNIMKPLRVDYPSYKVEKKAFLHSGVFVARHPERLNEMEKNNINRMDNEKLRQTKRFIALMEKEVTLLI